MAGQRIRDWPVGERPRERLHQGGAPGLADAELLAIILGRGVRGLSAVDLARRLLAELGGIRGVLNCPPHRLRQTRGMGPGKSAALAAVRECAIRYMASRRLPGQVIQSPEDCQDFLSARLRDKPHEVFCCLFLDSRHRVLALDELFRGTIDSTSVYPREVVKQALARNAAAVILAHNHPSGVAEPSQADEQITRRIKAALELVDIRLLDHVIIGDGCCESLASRGLI